MQTTRQIHFNTRRLYTENGQRITATLHPDMSVTFFDHDRGIDGEFKLCGDTFNQSSVMYAYDNNIAKNTRRSWQDAFMADGCNSEFVS